MSLTCWFARSTGFDHVSAHTRTSLRRRSRVSFPGPFGRRHKSCGAIPCHEHGTDLRTEPTREGPRVILDDTERHLSAPLNIRVTATTCAVWIAVRGELDLSNHDQLAQVLAGLSLAGISQVHLQLSNLSFCDVAGMRHLLTFIRRADSRGRQVAAYGASRSLRRLCHLMTDGKVRLDRHAPELTRRNSRTESPSPSSWISTAQS